ncbi:MAG: acyltransferase, partial [Solirubrobacterales bacterium]|nr:acyltransferase [Solirubrobacterales bacterium]
GVVFALDAPHGARWGTLPALEVDPRAGRGGTLTLRFGRDVQLGRDTVLDVRTGRDNAVSLADGVLLQAGTRFALYGGTIHIGEHSFVRDHVQLKVSGGEIDLGPRVQLGREVNLDAARSIVLGEHAGLAERTSILDSDHGHDGSDAFFMDQALKVGPVRIGRNVFIAANVVVLRGARVGDNSVVGAGALLRGEDYEGGWLYAGTPARAIRRLDGTPTADAPPA